MKRILFILSLVLLLSADVSPQQQYIDKYAPLAVSEMYRSGVPASITLAQGLLESRYGLSRLATEGNNHFGIKCHNWKGKKMYHDDDAKGECFRVYDDPEQSFLDHSDFLRYQDRYKFLFDLKTTDYKGWANGLKKAGYATDPAYPSKLIKLIEDYSLQKYDKMTVLQAEASVPAQKVEQSPAKGGSKAAKKDKKRRKNRRSMEEKYVDDTQKEIVASPNRLEADADTKISRDKASETIRFSLSRELRSRNGVPYILSTSGETYASVAKANNLFLKELLRYNDLAAEETLLPGTVVYLQPKKAQTERGLDKYIIAEDGEDLRAVAQRFGVKLSSIRKMNALASGYVPREGDTILLRKAAARKRK